MSKKRSSLKDNSPLAGFVSEATQTDAVTQSSSQAVKKTRKKAPAPEKSAEIQQETLYLYPEQVIDLEDLVLRMKRRNPRIKTSKSAVARAAIALLLAQTDDEIAGHLGQS